ncbi:hypothetical protein KJ855_04775 [Patescibacteria group bacterium]|nr:hypothetical protein [Patescibacteria group bacterium]
MKEAPFWGENKEEGEKVIMNLKSFVGNYNNFWLYFYRIHDGFEIYKNKEHYKKFVEKYSVFNNILCNEVKLNIERGKYCSVYQALEPLDLHLHWAYRLMSEFVDNPEDLLK